MRYLFFFLCLLFIVSCHKDDFNQNETVLTTFTAQVVTEINGSILGQVIDENNKPVADATVQIYSATTKTNAYGVFAFENVKMDQNGTYLTVRKQGYFLGSDMIYPKSARTYSDVRLMSLEKGKVLDATKGGAITISGGGTLIFPPAAIVDAGGATYNGQVEVSAKLISPADPFLNALMPGALVADAKDGNTVVLGTAGMFAVELRTDTGEELNLGNNKSVSFSIPALSTTKPASIGLWSFDESKGRWREEGVAVLSNGFYEGTVNHFSFWNCDAPFPLVEVCGKVVNHDNEAVKNAWITVEADGLYSATGSTDEEGVFCGKMPKGKKLTFSVRTGGYCTNPVFTTMVDPLSNNTQLNPFVIDIVNQQLLIKGKVVCGSNEVATAVVVFEAGNIRKVFKADANGFFDEDLSWLLCEDFDSYSLFAYDEVSGEAGQPISKNVGDSSASLLDICGNGCAFTGSVNYDCNRVMSVAVSNGSGIYTYKWSNGKTDASFQIGELDSAFTLYCVTVTDETAACSKTYCIEYKGVISLYMDGGECSSELRPYIYGGVQPYSYAWSNGSTTPFISIAQPGSYCVTVTDANGCTASKCSQISGPPLFVNTTTNSCSKETFSLVTSPFTGGTIYLSNGTNLPLTSTQNLSVFNTGFQFNMLISNNNCEKVFYINLPHTDSLSVTAFKTSCGTCDDGYATVSTGTECYECTIGDVKIFKSTDLNTDLSAANAAKALSKGLYYAVVTDKFTGCYIGFKKFEIN
jgi:hypothetical protein